MTGYNELAKLNAFSLLDAEKRAGNKKTAYSLFARLTKKGLVKKIRNNIYSCVNPATGQVIASKYQIACASSNSAYISHHTAFEYYGVANQVYYEVYISSDNRFKDFEFEGISYTYVASCKSGTVLDLHVTFPLSLTRRCFICHVGNENFVIDENLI